MMKNTMQRTSYFIGFLIIVAFLGFAEFCRSIEALTRAPYVLYNASR